jgi:hypothetical protein
MDYAPYAPISSGNQIRAEIVGCDRCTALGIEARTTAAPVLALCRLLIAAGHDPASPLDAYRGGTLCLRIRAIGEAAGLDINAKGSGFTSLRAVRTASPIEAFGQEAVR